MQALSPSKPQDLNDLLAIDAEARVLAQAHVDRLAA